MAALNEVVNLAAIGALEEAEILAERGRRRINIPQDPFSLTENQFIRMYRLNKDVTRELIELLRPYIPEGTTNSALSVPRKVLTALRFFASGSYQMDVGENSYHGLSQSSVSKCIKEVTDALNRPEILNYYVKLPRNDQELQQVRNRFYERHQFPGVIGIIDCTHVAIFPPNIDDDFYPEGAYVNRKGYHSINVQLICDQDLRIMNVCARFPGSCHDSHIWANSQAFTYIRNLHINGRKSYFFIGDSGYGLRPWLQVPIQNAADGSPEAAYNERLISTRSLIERCNGVLKMRFRCLLKHRVLHYNPETCSKIINSCVVLHNICINNNIPPVEIGDEDNRDLGIIDVIINEEEQNENRNRRNPDLVAGERVQQLIIRNYFVEY